MEEKPPVPAQQNPRGTDRPAPLDATKPAPLNATEPAPLNATTPSAPTGRTRRAPKAAPPVTFRPPTADDQPPAAPRRKTPSRTPQSPPTAAPTAESSTAEAPPPARKRTPRQAASPKSAPAKKTQREEAVPAAIPNEEATPQAAPRVEAPTSLDRGPAPHGTALAADEIPTQKPPSEATTDATAWGKLIAEPGHAPEVLAVAAVQSIGPAARDWATRTRRDYPHADAAALARLAITQFTRAAGFAGLGGAVAGAYAPAVMLTTVAVAHARLVLHLAAAYGLDPTDPARAAELLILAGMHANPQDARAALTGERQLAYEDGRAWRIGGSMAVTVGLWRVLRLVDRRLPGVASLVALVSGRAAAERMATRADALYRKLAAG